jgi:hypothetical protein
VGDRDQHKAPLAAALAPSPRIAGVVERARIKGVLGAPKEALESDRSEQLCAGPRVEGERLVDRDQERVGTYREAAIGWVEGAARGVVVNGGEFGAWLRPTLRLPCTRVWLRGCLGVGLGLQARKSRLVGMALGDRLRLTLDRDGNRSQQVRIDLDSICAGPWLSRVSDGRRLPDRSRVRWQRDCYPGRGRRPAPS